MNFVFNQSGDGNTQIGSIGKTNGPEWVRTADRMPTESDGEYVIARNKHGYMAGPDVRLVDIELLNRLKEDFTHWMPLPKLPEVENDKNASL